MFSVFQLSIYSHKSHERDSNPPFPKPSDAQWAAFVLGAKLRFNDDEEAVFPIILPTPRVMPFRERGG